jgi:hypothetical protein
MDMQTLNVAAEPTGPDAALLQMCEEILHVEFEYRRVGKVMSDNPNLYAVEDHFSAVEDAHSELMEEIASTPARTPEGFRAKAAAIRAFYDNVPPDTDCTIDRVTWAPICEIGGSAPA